MARPSEFDERAPAVEKVIEAGAQTVVEVALATKVSRMTLYRDMQKRPSFAALFTPLRRFAPVLVGLLLALPLGATSTSSPVDLGAAGLDVDVTLLRWQESAPDAWPEVSATGVTVNDLGGGLYTVSGLPLATGLTRYAVRLSAGGVGLFTYAYGAQPGVRLVWQQELALPAAPTVFKQGDTAGSIALHVLRRLPAAACEPEAELTITAANATTGVALFTDRAATISNCTLDATTGTYGALFTYDLQAGDTAAVAKYAAEFRICYSPSSCQTLPSDGRLRFEVVRRLGG